tara:strand:- start:151 stop:708 length:558 start_codon:yes stop_codon:yes gene_type:complete
MIKIIFCLIITSIFIISCSNVRQSAGVNRKVIDEYTVIENPPLVIPPNFNLLPPEQIKSKDIKDADSELAKEILFGLENDNEKKLVKNSLMSKIINETQANEIDSNIRETVNQEFAGEKSSKKDETNFQTEDELNAAIKATADKDIDNKNKKEKKKKRFFFFNNKKENEDGEEDEPKKKKRFFFF